MDDKQRQDNKNSDLRLLAKLLKNKQEDETSWLNLGDNNIGHSDSTSFCEFTSSLHNINHTNNTVEKSCIKLTLLNIDRNEIEAKKCNDIAKALRLNNILTTLELHNNNIQARGCIDLMKAF